MLLQLWRQIFNMHKQRRPLWLLKVTEEEGKTQLEHLDSWVALDVASHPETSLQPKQTEYSDLLNIFCYKDNIFHR